MVAVATKGKRFLVLAIMQCVGRWTVQHLGLLQCGLKKNRIEIDGIRVQKLYCLMLCWEMKQSGQNKTCLKKTKHKFRVLLVIIHLCMWTLFLTFEPSMGSTATFGKHLVIASLMLNSKQGPILGFFGTTKLDLNPMYPNLSGNKCTGLPNINNLILVSVL